METVGDIIKAAGGAAKIGRATGLDRTTPLKWKESGIPERHWPEVTKLSGASAEQIYAANRRARGEGTSPTRSGFKGAQPRRAGGDRNAA